MLTVPSQMSNRSVPEESADWPEVGVPATQGEPPTGRPVPDEAPIRRWTQNEAQALIRAQPSVSPWRVVATQVAVGFLCGALGWLLAGPAAGWSALYGAAAAALPNALMARGMTRGAGNAAAAAVGFLFWEMLKIGAAIAMLVIAGRVVPHLSWPVLLVTMVVCMKVNWFALLWRGRR